MDTKDYCLLVVDDVEANRDMLSRRLQRKGYQVLVAEDGETALQMLGENRVDLVLLDIMMPGIDGIEVLKRLRQKQSQSQLPVIMTTAKDDSRDVVEALDLGANDYVTKPLNFPIVLARVESQLRTRASGPAPEPTHAELKPGAILAHKYRLGKSIGTGTYGTVYRATHVELADDVAVKILLSGITASEKAVARFRQEGISACRIKHPNAVTVTDFGVTGGGVAYLVMELLQGVSLAEEIGHHAPLSPQRCVEILQPVCDVLTEAHAAGIVHRDIKPENIFLHRTSRGEVVKVLDFGIAKLGDDASVQSNLTAQGFVLGTPAYMAPERLTNKPYDGRSDVYSLGIMLFLMLTGRLPFVPNTKAPMELLMRQVKEDPPLLRSLRPDLSDELEEVVARSVAKSPEQRPDTQTLADRLAEAVADLEKPTLSLPRITREEAAAVLQPTVARNEVATPATKPGWWRRLRNKIGKAEPG